jgi:hypothetical protein
MLEIPGYDEAIEREQSARNLIYLGQPEFVCGFKIKNITPRLLARLNAVDTPFLRGSIDATYAHVGQFIWILSVNFTLNKFIRYFRRRAIKRKIHLSDLRLCIHEIDALIRLTFIDCVAGKGSNTAPIASGIAWLEYRMSCAPFNWHSERTLDTPLRRLYQLIRCWRAENGETVVNNSHKLRGDWLDTLNAKLASGEIKADELQKIFDGYNGRRS